MFITLHLLQYRRYVFFINVIYIYEAQPRELHDMYLLAATLEACCHAEARHHVFVAFGSLLVACGAGIAVLLGKVAHGLVGTHHRHQFHEGDGPRLRVVHTAKEA